MLDLHLPTLGEAVALAKNHDVPGVSGSDSFWTDERFVTSGTPTQAADTVDEDGNVGFAQTFGDTRQTVCVTDPSA